MSAKFLLQLREGRHVTQRAIQEVISGCRALVHQTVEEVKSKIQIRLSRGGNDGSDNLLADEDFSYTDPFEGIDTAYLFKKFCKDHLGYLVRYCYTSTSHFLKSNNMHHY